MMLFRMDKNCLNFNCFFSIFLTKMEQLLITSHLEKVFLHNIFVGGEV